MDVWLLVFSPLSEFMFSQGKTRVKKNAPCRIDTKMHDAGSKNLIGPAGKDRHDRIMKQVGLHR